MELPEQNLKLRACLGRQSVHLIDNYLMVAVQVHSQERDCLSQSCHLNPACGPNPCEASLPHQRPGDSSTEIQPLDELTKWIRIVSL